MKLTGMLAVASLVAGIAHADSAVTGKLADDELGTHDGPPAALQINQGSVDVAPKHTGYNYNASTTSPAAGARTIGASSDGTASWVAEDVHLMHECRRGDCAQLAKDDKAIIAEHFTALFDGDKPVVLHLGDTIADKDLAKRDTFTQPAALADATGPGAEVLAPIVKAVLADSKSFAGAVSDRADVVLYGSDPTERYVGGATVKKTLLAWKLNLAKRDGVASGLTSSKTVGWIALNVDAGDTRMTPYRLTLVVDKQKDGWRIVQIHFSYSS